MSDLQEIGLTTLLKSNTSVSMAEAQDDEEVLFTCPPDKEAIITSVVIRELSAGCPTAVMTFGINTGSCDDFLGDQLLTNASGATKYVVLYSDQGTSQTPEGGTIMTAGDTFRMEVTTADVDGGTATIDVFGYLYDAP